MNEGLSTALILAALTTFEGVRQVPHEAIVLRQALAGPWRHVQPLRFGRSFALPAAGVPLFVSIVVRPGDNGLAVSRVATRLRARLRRVGKIVAALRVLGLCSLGVLIGGLPYLTGRSGVWGLLVCLATLLVLSVAQAAGTYAGMRRAGATVRISAQTSARVLWPFSTPWAAGHVLQQAVAGAAPAIAAHVMLENADFRKLVRPMAYDVLRNSAGIGGEALRALCGTETLRSIVRTPPEHEANFCPRCASGYEHRVLECMECEGVPLVGA
jgi:hypothetical protein